jgi:hypothetical protein
MCQMPSTRATQLAAGVLDRSLGAIGLGLAFEVRLPFVLVGSGSSRLVWVSPSSPPARWRRRSARESVGVRVFLGIGRRCGRQCVVTPRTVDVDAVARIGATTVWGCGLSLIRHGADR